LSSLSIHFTSPSVISYFIPPLHTIPVILCLLFSAPRIAHAPFRSFGIAHLLLTPPHVPSPSPHVSSHPPASSRVPPISAHLPVSPLPKHLPPFLVFCTLLYQY
jgi:hypothetical protein